MKPLIEIKSIPMSIQLKINNASLQLASGNAAVEITRDNGGFQMKMQPAKLKIDTFEARNSTVFKSPMTSAKEFAKKGVQAGYEATGNFAREGDMLLNIHLNDDVFSDIAYQRMQSDTTFNLGFTPSEPINIQVNPSELFIKYEMDKLNFDWKLNRPEMKFTPGNIEIIIKEYAKVELNYIGPPIYVPPSADPNYISNKLDTRA